MPLQLLHQVGHNSNWNIESYQRDHCGDGLILSPLHQNLAAVEQLDPGTRTACIFDPQFYLPSSRKPKLHSYPFFPEAVEGGFQTSTFASHVAGVAETCVEFQRDLGFRTIVVPTRFLDEMYSDYFDRQRRFTVDAFMEAAAGKTVCLSVAITAAMIEDSGFRTRLLNWVTSYPNVDELYLIYQHSRDTKQIQDAHFLSACMEFFREIIGTGLKLIVGYTNTEGLLFATSADLTVTMGAFENTRIFSVDKFVETEGQRRGPKARIYLSGLLNWVQLQDAKTIQNRSPKIWDAVYERTDWADQALASPVEPTFNQPQLYKHFFQNLHDHVTSLKALSLQERRLDLIERLRRARGWYSEIEGAGIQLERHGRGDHIGTWLSVLLPR
jgi:hypothetical protein